MSYAPFRPAPSQGTPRPGAEPRAFLFDTVFDGDRVIAPVKPKTSFTLDDLQAARAEGFAAGRDSELARAEAQAAKALTRAEAEIRAGLAALKAVAHEHRTASAELALACGRAIASAALDRLPDAAARAALESLAREIEAQPRLTLRAAPADAERLGQTLIAAAEAMGFGGQVIVRADATVGPAAFSFEWGDGRASFDPAAASARVGEALAAALAAEGLHAEPPPLDLAPDLS